MADFLHDDAFQVGVKVAEALERHRVSHALGGALAYGAWAIGRGTHDVDVNVFVTPERLDGVFAALKDLGAELDPKRAVDEATREGMFEACVDGMRVDLFVPSIAFSWEAERTRVQVSDGTRRLWVLSAEALSVFKLLFFRSKDLADLERLVAIAGGSLDTAYIRRHIVEMMGEGDPRVMAWDRLVSEFGPPPGAP